MADSKRLEQRPAKWLTVTLATGVVFECLRVVVARPSGGFDVAQLLVSVPPVVWCLYVCRRGRTRQERLVGLLALVVACWFFFIGVFWNAFGE